jgi:uncharacterized protein (TIGR00369 family)
MARINPPLVEFDPAFVAGIVEMWEHQIPFNKVLGLRLDSITPAQVTGHLDMTPALIGNFYHERLHGGVISAGLDSMGGLAVMAAIAARHMDEPIERRLERFLKIGTIDLRVDYLRPGIGKTFELRGEVMRLGSRVASTRMAFLDADGQLLSTGAGAYIVS